MAGDFSVWSRAQESRACLASGSGPLPALHPPGGSGIKGKRRSVRQDTHRHAIRHTTVIGQEPEGDVGPSAVPM